MGLLLTGLRAFVLRRCLLGDRLLVRSFYGRPDDRSTDLLLRLLATRTSHYKAKYVQYYEEDEHEDE